MRYIRVRQGRLGWLSFDKVWCGTATQLRCSSVRLGRVGYGLARQIWQGGIGLCGVWWDGVRFGRAVEVWLCIVGYGMARLS